MTHKTSSSFCVVPFSNLILEPNGSVGVCRTKGTECSVGNIQDNTILECFNSEKIREWRKEFLTNNIKTCAQEIKHQKCNQCPELKVIKNNITIFSEYMTRPYKFTANLNGKCNLQCQMCHIWKFPNGVYDKTNFWSDATENIFPYIKEIDLLSGEPFIQKDTYKLITILHKLNPELKWFFTTNAHWKLTDKIKHYLDKIKIKHIMLSIDSLDEKIYHKIRFPGRLHIALRNVNLLLEYEQSRITRGLTPLNIKWSFLVQKDNWHELAYFFKYISNLNVESYISFLYEPSKFSLLTLPINQIEYILTTWIDELNWIQICRSTRAINPLLEVITPIGKVEILEKLKQKKDNFYR